MACPLPFAVMASAAVTAVALRTRTMTPAIDARRAGTPVSMGDPGGG